MLTMLSNSDKIVNEQHIPKAVIYFMQRMLTMLSSSDKIVNEQHIPKAVIYFMQRLMEFLLYYSVDLRKPSIIPLLLAAFILKTPHRGKLVAPALLSPQELLNYQKYQEPPHKQEFRRQLADILGLEFTKMTQYLQKDGVILFRDLICPTRFAKLVRNYDEKLSGTGRCSMGHNFFDFRRHKDFLLNPDFKEAFFHPLLIALLAHEMGGPIRLVDVRGKNTEPTLTTDRDNGVHIDDSIYVREYKFLIVWETGKASGPQGQNFVAIPGTNHFIRVVPSEHGANFRTPAEISREILANPALSKNVFVMEAEDERPLTIVFEATAIAHHRFRTDEKPASRSCLILVFHVDELDKLPIVYLHDILDSSEPLERFVAGGIGNGFNIITRNKMFLKLIAQSKDTIMQKLKEVYREHKFIPAAEKRLSSLQTVSWLHTIGRTPSLEDRKPRLCRTDYTKQEFIDNLFRILELDKHADLDLVLYPDRRELPRKSVRTRIRETLSSELQGRPKTRQRFCALYPVNTSSFMELELLAKYAINLKEILIDFNKREFCEFSEDKLFVEEIQGFIQLIADLGNSIMRCKSLQEFRTNSLFLYLVFDDVWQIFDDRDCGENYKREIDENAQKLLQHYAALVSYDDYHYQHYCDSQVNSQEDISMAVKEYQKATINNHP